MRSQILDGRARSRRRLFKPVAVVLAAGLLAGSVNIFDGVANPTSAQAITPAAGVNTMGGFIGGYRHSNGHLVFCVEMGLPPRVGNNAVMGSVSALRGYTATDFYSGVGNWFNIQAPAFSGAGLKTMNKILARYGQTADNGQAAAVQIALWHLRAAGANASYQSMLQAMKGAAGAAITARALGMIQEAEASIVAETAPKDPRIVSVTPYKGHVVVDPGTTELSITNGVFDTTGTSTISFPGGTNSVQTIPWTGRPPHNAASWDRYYRVTVNGRYVYQVSPSQVIYGHPGGYAQGIVYGEENRPVEGSYNAVGIDPDMLWSPTLSTVTPAKFIQRGESFSDDITFGVANGSNPWRQAVTSTGETRFAPITAQGTLYGPFLHDPALNPAASAPNGAPVAATATVTTDALRGPGTYSVSQVGNSKEAGYYTWVWSITGSDQLPAIVSPPNGSDSSLPVNYFATDGFGQASEGQVTPSQLRWSTQLSKESVTVGESFTDDVRVSLQNGGWLQTNGVRTPFTLRGTVYLLDDKPVQSATVPANVQPYSTTNLVVDDVGSFTSAAIDIPVDTAAKYVTVQWCLFDQDQPVLSQGKAEPWCDDFGVPTETAKLSRPNVTSTALEVGAYKGEIYDVAHVSGDIVSGMGNHVDFTYYLTPKAGDVKYDQNWEIVRDGNGDPVVWLDTEVADPAAVCMAQPVGTTARVEVRGAGAVKSPPLIAKSLGEGFWVERYYVTPPGGSEVLLHEGKCGVESEKTKIVYPRVSTQAKSRVMVGEEIFDTAIVTGPVAESVDYKVTFKAYKRGSDGTLECSAANEIKDFADQVGVRFNKPGRYPSKKVVTRKEHVGLGGYVETVSKIEDGVETVISVGKCGAAPESFTVEPELPKTGSVGLASGSLLIGGGLVAVGAGVIFLRRRTTISAS